MPTRGCQTGRPHGRPDRAHGSAGSRQSSVSRFPRSAGVAWGQVGMLLDTRHDLPIRVKRGLLVEWKPLHGGVGTAGECHEGTEHHHGPTPTLMCRLSLVGLLLAGCRSTGSRNAVLSSLARHAGVHRQPEGCPKGDTDPLRLLAPAMRDRCDGLYVLDLLIDNFALSDEGTLRHRRLLSLLRAWAPTPPCQQDIKRPRPRTHEEQEREQNNWASSERISCNTAQKPTCGGTVGAGAARCPAAGGFSSRRWRPRYR